MAFLYYRVFCNHAVSLLFHSIDFLPDVRHKDMLQLLEKIPFSDPSALTSTYQTFGKQVYDVLRKVDVKKDDDPKPSDLRYHVENKHHCSLQNLYIMSMGSLNATP